MGVAQNAHSVITGFPVPMAKQREKKRQSHHDKQKSHPNILDISLGAWTSTYSRAPVFVINRITQHEINAIITAAQRNSIINIPPYKLNNRLSVPRNKAALNTGYLFPVASSL